MTGGLHATYTPSPGGLRVAVRLMPRAARDAIQGTTHRLKLLDVAGDGPQRAERLDALLRP